MIAVVAILAAVLTPTFFGIIDKANISAAEQEARNAYTNYLAQHASDSQFATKVCVKVNDYYVFLDNGSVKTELTAKKLADGMTFTGNIKTPTLNDGKLSFTAAVATDTDFYQCCNLTDGNLVLVGSGS